MKVATVFLALASFWAMGWLAACGSTVHAGCTSNADCSSLCVVNNGGGDFPGGLCTEKCTRANDCPGGSTCIEKVGGICAKKCSSIEECQAFGNGYICKNKDDLQGVPKLVCLGD